MTNDFDPCRYDMDFFADLLADDLELGAILSAATYFFGQFVNDLDTRQFGRQGNTTAATAASTTVSSREVSLQTSPVLPISSRTAEAEIESEQQMASPRQQISAQELIQDIILRVEAAERMINNGLTHMIDNAPTAEERQKREDQKAHFWVLLLTIRMNIDSFKRRNLTVFRAIEARDRTATSILILDPDEAVAIDNARTLYERIRAHIKG